MTKTIYAGARLPIDEKLEAEAILKDMGLTLANYIHMMVAQLRINRSIPALSQYPTSLSVNSARVADAYTRGEFVGKGQSFATVDEAIDALGI